VASSLNAGDDTVNSAGMPAAAPAAGASKSANTQPRAVFNIVIGSPDNAGALSGKVESF
jgi:hypothetical protein